MTSPRRHSFPTSEPIEVEIHNPAGEVLVTAAGQGDATVELLPLSGRGSDHAVERALVTYADGRLRVVCDENRVGRSRPVRVTVTVPDGSSVRARTASADVDLRGRADSVEVDTASGRVTVEDVDGGARVGTASGDVTLHLVVGDLRIRTASGNLRCGRAGALHAESASGDVWVEELGGAAEVKTASGEVQIGCAGRGDLVLGAVSGDISIGVAPGAVAHLTASTLSGSVRNELPVEDSAPGDGVEVRIRARTLSGDITIGRAAVARRG